MYFWVTCSFVCGRGRYESFGVWIQASDPDAATERTRVADRIRENLNFLEPPERHVGPLWDLRILSARPQGHRLF